MEDLSEQVEVRLGKLGKLRETLGNAYPNGFEPKHLAVPLHEEYDSISKEDLDPKGIPVSIAGRMMAVRSFGKAAFAQVNDRTGKIQLYVQKKKLGDESFSFFSDLDIGDLVYAEGTLFKTKTNELSVDCTSLQLMTKSLRPFPEKFHGLTDVEVRYRQRYLDLIMSEESRETFVKRSKIVASIRQYFTEKGFLEVETPMMHGLIGGAAAKPFVTHHNTLDMQLFLRIAPELYLKRLVVGGFHRVFEINRNFRNEGMSIQHNPEFTMLEFYQAFATYEDLMNLTEDLFQVVANDVLGNTTFTYQGEELRFGGKWERISVEEAVLKHSGFQDPGKIRDKDALTAYVEEKGYEVHSHQGPGGILMTIFEEEAEPKFIQPTFVTHFPTEVSPLSRKNDKDPELVDRFELYIFGREIANAFSELNDPMDQRERFQAQVDAKEAGDGETCDMDEDYIRALEYGLPPTAGEGIGIDRLVMLLTDAPSIRDVILFPQMRKKS